VACSAALGAKLGIEDRYCQGKEILDEDHYELKKVKDRILDYLSVLELKPDMKGRSCALWVLRAWARRAWGGRLRGAGRKFQRVSLGGMHDEAEIRGTGERTLARFRGRLFKASAGLTATIR